jgi:putative flippase GtrA
MVNSSVDSPPFAIRAITQLLRRDPPAIALHVTFALFATVSFFLALHHTPWRDEAQVWLLARDLSIWELFQDARHEGHPILWPLCVKVVQATGANYLGMMLLNWTFMAAGIWLLLYRSAVPLLAKVVLTLCPASLFQISFIARDYAISVFLMFLAARLYPRGGEKPLWFCVVLALLASTNSYAAAVFVGISFQFLLEQTYSFGKRPFSLRPLVKQFLIPNLMLLAGAVLLIAQLAPVPLASEPKGVRPTLTVELSNLGFLLTIIFATPIALLCFSKCPGCPRICGGIPTVGLALIPTLTYGCGSRHSFMLVCEVVYFIWIYLDDIIRAIKPSGDSVKERSSIVFATILIITGCIACQPGGLRTAFHNHSDSYRTAQAIIRENLDRPGTLLVTTDPCRVTAVLLFLKNIRQTYGPPPYGPPPQSFADFYLTRLRKHVPTIEELKPLVLKIARENPASTILVVSADPVQNNNFNDPDLSFELIPIYQSPLKAFAYNDDELFQVYTLKRSQ